MNLKYNNIKTMGMRQGIQTNFPNENIQKWGCYFLALMKWAELSLSDFGATYNEEDILNFYHEFVRRGWMRESCYVLNAVSMLNYAIGETRYTSNRWQAEPVKAPLFIMQLTKPGYEHYVLGNSGTNLGEIVLWDGLDPNRPAAKDYKVNNYGVFTRAA